MSVHHHLDDATIVRYASGDLDEAFAIVVATHLAMCPDCRGAVRLAERVGGHLLETGKTEPAQLSFEALMRRIDAGGGEVEAAGAAEAEPSEIPLPLARRIGGSFDEINWQFVAPGVRKRDVDLGENSSSSLFLLKIDPGRKVPEHGHGGAEMTVILSGSYRDSLGRFAAGDIADLDEHVEHQPEVDSDGPCICVVATEAPTRFRGPVSRLMQRFVGI